MPRTTYGVILKQRTLWQLAISAIKRLRETVIAKRFKERNSEPRIAQIARTQRLGPCNLRNLRLDLIRFLRYAKSPRVNPNSPISEYVHATLAPYAQGHD